MYERTHPFTIFSNLRRVLYLIIIPLLRGLFSALQLDLVSWARGAWIDILIFVLMIAVSILRWFTMGYTCDDRTFSLRKGIVFRRLTTIYWDKVTTLSNIESFYLRPFRASYFRVDTMGGSFQQADVSLYLNRDRARAILEAHSDAPTDSTKRQYVPGARSILTMSLLTSNSFGGIVFIATFVSQSGKLLGNEFSSMLVTTFEDIIRHLAFGIPPAAAAIAYVLIGGWLIGFLLNFMSYHDFVISKRDSTLCISGGSVTSRGYVIRTDQINLIDIRQNIAAKAFRLYSLYLSAVGYGKRKDDISCIIPNEEAKNFRANCRLLFPEFTPAPIAVRAHRRNILRFIGQPLVPCLGVPAAMGVLWIIFPSWVSFILFTGLMSMVPSLLFLVVRILEFRSGGIAKAGKCYTISNSKGLTLHTVVIPESKIVSVVLRQSLFQLRGPTPTCDVLVYTVAEGKTRHRCRSLPQAEAEALFNLNPQ